MSIFLQPLQTVTVGSGGAGSVTFSSIPQTYTDLLVKISARDSYAGYNPDVGYTINGDGGANYSNTRLFGSGTYTASDQQANRTIGLWGMLPGSLETTNVFGSIDFYISNYTGSNYKQIIVDGVTEGNYSTASGGWQDLYATMWRGTAAVSSITFFSASSIVQYSKFSLYGVLRQGI